MLAKGASSNPSSHVNKRTTEDLYTTEYEINDVRIGIRNILTKVGGAIDCLAAAKSIA